MPLYVINMRLH